MKLVVFWDIWFVYLGNLLVCEQDWPEPQLLIICTFHQILKKSSSGGGKVGRESRIRRTDEKYLKNYSWNTWREKPRGSWSLDMWECNIKGDECDTLAGTGFARLRERCTFVNMLKILCAWCLKIANTRVIIILHLLLPLIVLFHY
jgi:hypothetical protein